MRLFGAPLWLGLALSINLTVEAAPLGNALSGKESPLSLADYLAQVGDKNNTLKSVRQQNSSYDLAAKEPLTAFSPMLTGNYKHSETQNIQQPGTIIGSSSDSLASAWDLGISKLFFTGTQVSVGYSSAWDVTEYGAAEGSASLLNSFSSAQQQQLYSLFNTNYTGDWYTSVPTLSISQSLWKGFMARGANISIEKTRYNYNSLQETNRQQAQDVYYQAEQAYIQLALAQATVEVQQSALERSQKIFEWSSQRARKNLADRADVVASQAAVKSAQVSLESDQQSLSIAARDFNALRGQTDVQVSEHLSGLRLPSEALVQRLADRHDVQAAAWTLKADEAAAEEAVEKYRPDLSAFYNCSFNGADSSYTQAWEHPDHVAWAAGIKLSANIDFSLIHEVVEGAKGATGSSKQALLQKQSDLDRDWDNLKIQWRNIRQRLGDVEELVALQKEKVELEKARFTHGRTTNYQVLSYENDYSAALLARISLVAEACKVAALAKYYNGAY
jgi:outer membrane protein TolC